MSETSWGRVKYRTTNWKAYNAALKARGDLTIWLDKDMQWLAQPRGKRGRCQKFSDAAIQSCRQLGRAIWKRWSGYHRRSLVETKMNCFKRLCEKVMARTFERQVAELNIRASILNQFTALGTPQKVAAA